MMKAIILGEQQSEKRFKSPRLEFDSPNIDSKTDSKVDEQRWCSVIRDEQAEGILSTAQTWADTSEGSLCNPVCATEVNFHNVSSRLTPGSGRSFFWPIPSSTATRIFLLNLM